MLSMQLVLREYLGESSCKGIIIFLSNSGFIGDTRHVWWVLLLVVLNWTKAKHEMVKHFLFNHISDIHQEDPVAVGICQTTSQTEPVVWIPPRYFTEGIHIDQVLLIELYLGSNFGMLIFLMIRQSYKIIFIMGVLVFTTWSHTCSNIQTGCVLFFVFIFNDAW